MMADLVEYSTCEKVWACDRLVCNAPLDVLPAQPVANLCVRGEQQDTAGIDELECQDKARVVGSVIELHGQISADAEPIVIDAPPVLVGRRIVTAHEGHFRRLSRCGGRF